MNEEKKNRELFRECLKLDHDFSFATLSVDLFRIEFLLFHLRTRFELLPNTSHSSDGDESCGGETK